MVTYPPETALPPGVLGGFKTAAMTQWSRAVWLGNGLEHSRASFDDTPPQEKWIGSELSYGPMLVSNEETLRARTRLRVGATS